jgi:subfamily B ATP-binding cassette protein MsbA
MAEEKVRKKINYSRAWLTAKRLIWDYRWRLFIGLGLMLISRAAGLVLPYSTKFLVDNVFGQGQFELLKWIALAVGVASLISAFTSFALSQVLGVAAQRAITEMRKRVQAHIERLPVSYFDSTQTGQLISRIMRDAEGIRNLVGTGLGQILGGLVSALVSMAVLFYLNWQMTLITLSVLAAFGYVLSYAFRKLRPLFRERGEIEAQVTGRLNEGLGGIRIVKAYTAEKREDLSFARGAHRLFRNIAKSMTGVSATGSFAALIIGAVAMVMIYFGGNAVIANTQNPSAGMTSGDFAMYIAFTIFMVMPIVDRHANHGSLCRFGPNLGDFSDEH